MEVRRRHAAESFGEDSGQGGAKNEDKLNDAGGERAQAFLPQTSKARTWCRVIAYKILFVGFVLYIAIPCWFYSCLWLRQHIVFLPFINFPLFRNLSDPEGFGLYCPRNFYIETEPDLRLGAWYIPSRNQACVEAEPMFLGSDPVVLYLHGNSGSRGGSHRVELYKMLSSDARAHVIAMDYRGYGDSSTSSTPSVAGLVSDALHMYAKIRENVSKNRIVVWGHSLGTGVAAYLMANLTRLNDLPGALVLESPFDVLAHVVKHHPLSRFHRFMPFFQEVFVDSIKNHPSTNFDSLGRVKDISVTLPVVILHAEDDSVIPFKLADRLYSEFASYRQNMPQSALLKFMTFPKELGYGHKYIFTHPGLGEQMRAIFDQVTLPLTQQDG